MKYYKLTDKEHRDMVVRIGGGVSETYYEGEWRRSAIMVHYFTDISDRFGMFEEITEKEALELISD